MMTLTNKKHKIVKKIIIIIIMLSSLSYINIKTIYAENEINISISKNIINETLHIGEIKNIEIEISNTGNNTLDYYMTYSSNLKLDENTVGLWYFNEIVQNQIIDETLNNNGTIQGGYLTQGKFGNSFKFDGIDDYVIIQNSPNLNVESITLETWFKIAKITGSSPIGAIKYLNYGILYTDQDKLIPHIWAGGLKFYEKNVQLPKNEWLYISTTFNSKTGYLNLYINGELIESRKEGANSIDVNSNDLLFGRAWTENMAYYFNGEIDEVRISNKIRSPEEIKNNFERAITGKGEWIQLTNNSGNINPKDEKKITISLNASNLDPGTYNRELTLFSNDTKTPSITVPVFLEVLPEMHDISIVNIESNETGIAGQEFRLSAIISNKGTSQENHVLIDFIVDNTIINSTTIEQIDPQETMQIPFSWTPKIAKEYEINIKITPIPGESFLSNNELITLTLISGLPKIEVFPTFLEYSIDPGEISEKKISISNNGHSNLDFQIFDKSGFYEFWDDMENGPNGWTHSGFQDNWEYGTPESGPEDLPSGDNCWGTDLDANYREFTNCSLISPIIDLTQNIQPYLIFENWYSIDELADRGYVEIWDGKKWHTLNPEGYKGYSNGWLTESYSLTAYKGLQIRIRFRLSADEDVLDKGWFIDDVRIINPTIKEYDWLSESPSMGSIPPNNTLNIIITANSSKLDLGRHEDIIIIKSNDIANRAISIPITLTVKGVDTIPPKADAGKDIVANQNDIVQFNGSNSSDNFRVRTYTWIFTDYSEIVLYGVRPMYNFTNPGIYNVTLYVNDTSGNQASDDLIVKIKDITKPVAIAGENVTKYVGNLIEFDGTKSTDNYEIVNYKWNLGDGTTIEGDKISHIYKKPGNYVVELTVTDAEGNYHTDYVQVSIRPAEGSGVFLILIYVAFIFVLIWLFQQYYIKKR